MVERIEQLATNLRFCPLPKEVEILGSGQVPGHRPRTRQGHAGGISVVASPGSRYRKGRLVEDRLVALDKIAHGTGEVAVSDPVRSSAKLVSIGRIDAGEPGRSAWTRQHGRNTGDLPPRNNFIEERGGVGQKSLSFSDRQFIDVAESQDLPADIRVIGTLEAAVPLVLVVSRGVGAQVGVGESFSPRVVGVEGQAAADSAVRLDGQSVIDRRCASLRIAKVAKLLVGKI